MTRPLLLPHTISIHAPREGCDARCQTSREVGALISIHAPREGCDPSIIRESFFDIISIHAPREGCDEGQAGPVHHDLHFNPRTPRGVRRGIAHARGRGPWYFNPRTPRGVRRAAADHGQQRYPISIHAPREGCDYTRFGMVDNPAEISIHAPREGCDGWRGGSPCRLC